MNKMILSRDGALLAFLREGVVDVLATDNLDTVIVSLPVTEGTLCMCVCVRACD